MKATLCARMGTLALKCLVLMLLAASLGTAATLTVCPNSCQYSDLQTALAAANTGDTVSVGPGTYTAVQNASAGHLQGIFDIVTSGITVKSTSGAASTTLQVSNSADYPVLRIQGNNTVVDGFTIQNAAYGVIVVSQTAPIHAISGVVIRNLVMNPLYVGQPGGVGILLTASNSVIEGCDIKNAVNSGISLAAGSDNNFILNNTVERTVDGSGYGFVLTASNNNVVAGNTVLYSGFGALTVIGSTGNRIERNSFGGQFAGITVTDNGNLTPRVPSTGNWVGKNILQSTDFSNGKTYGSGVWVNANATGNLVFGNVLTGFVENGISVFNSTSNLFRGNYTYRNQNGGIYMTTASTSYPPTLAPVNNVIQHNLFSDQQNSGLVFVSQSGANDVGFNMVAAGPDTGSIGTGGIVLQTTTNVNLYRNTIINEPSTFNVANDVNGASVVKNRVFATPPYYQLAAQGAIVAWDGGPRLGGNYWYGFNANGDPSNGSTPFTSFNGGTFVDHYPYQHETLGSTYQVQITQPAAGALVAGGSQKTIAWTSQACVYVDLWYKRASGGTTLIQGNYPDTGYFNWSVPSGLTAGTDYQIQVDCKNSSQVDTGVSVSSGIFTVTSNSLVLLSPNSDVITNAGGTLMVGWTKDPSITGVNISYSTDGNIWSALATDVTDSFAYVTAPNVNSNQVRLRIQDTNNPTANADSGDGLFTVRSGGTGSFISPTSSNLVLGSEVQVQWISPQNSAYVDLALVINRVTTPIVSNLADFGQYSWMVPDAIGSNGLLQLTFLDSNFNTLATAQSGLFSVALTSAQPPTAVSVSPTGGNSSSQTFAATVSDLSGASNITTSYLLINSSLSASAACYIEYNRAANTLRLVNDAASAWLGPVTPGTGSSINNSQCTLNPVGSSVSTNGDNLTYDVALTFSGSFAGTKSLFLVANDANGLTSNFQNMGTWTIPAGANVPSAVSIAPNAGNGAAQTFALAMSDTAGPAAIGTAYFLVNSALSGSNGCYIEYNRGANTLRLATDAGTGWLGPVTLGTGSSINNSQCTLNPASSSAAISGNSITVNVALSFSGGFAGAKSMWLVVNDASGPTSGFQSLGSWTVLGSGGVPSAVSVTPASGSGSTQNFGLLISDTGGAGAITTAYFLMNSGLSGSNGCFIEYNRGANTLRLVNDAATAWLGPVTPGTGSSINNSQCTLNPASSSVAPNGNNITVNVALSFSAGFAGSKTMWLTVNDSTGASTGFQNRGAWTVTAASGVPAAVSVTPGSGGGVATLWFALVVSDTAGPGAITTSYFIVNSGLSGSNGCFIEYNRGANTLRLANDAASGWLGPVTPGTGASINNSQCTLNSASSSVASSGNNVTITVALGFSGAFAGTKGLWLVANDSSGTSSGFQNMGSWMVAGPSAVSIGPNSGSGATQTFALSVSDTAGPAAITTAYFLVNATLSGSNGCFIQYNRGANTLQLANDAASGWLGPVTPGMGVSINNSHCTLNPAASSVTTSGDNITVNVALGFTSFSGGKTMWLVANDAALSTGFQSLGIWTVP